MIVANIFGDPSASFWLNPETVRGHLELDEGVDTKKGVASGNSGSNSRNKRALNMKTSVSNPHLRTSCSVQW